MTIQVVELTKTSKNKNARLYLILNHKKQESYLGLVMKKNKTQIKIIKRIDNENTKV